MATLSTSLSLPGDRAATDLSREGERRNMEVTVSRPPTRASYWRHMGPRQVTPSLTRLLACHR